jgi:hypothetical protein
MRVGRRQLRAIQATTAAGALEALHWSLNHDRIGVVLQSMIDPDTYLRGPFVTSVFGRHVDEADKDFSAIAGREVA